MAYYTQTYTFPSLTTARGTEVSQELTAIQAGFASVEAAVSALSTGSAPGFAAAIDTRFTATDTGAANAIVFTPNPAPASSDVLTAGLWWLVKPVASNTGATTVKVGVLTAVNLKKDDGAGTLVDLSGRDIVAHQPAGLYFDGAQFLLVNPAGGATNIYTTQLFGV